MKRVFKPKIIIAFILILTLNACQNKQKEVSKLLQLGLAKIETGNLEAAISDYDKAIELDPENYFPYYHRGMVLIKLDKHNEACLDIEKTISLIEKDGLENEDVKTLYTKCLNIQKLFCNQKSENTSQSNMNQPHKNQYKKTNKTKSNDFLVEVDTATFNPSNNYVVDEDFTYSDDATDAINNPRKYIQINYSWRKNLLGDGVIEFDATNKSNTTDYGDFTFNIEFLNSEGVYLSEKITKVKNSILASGSKQGYNFTTVVPSSTSKIKLKLISAEAWAHPGKAYAP